MSKRSGLYLLFLYYMSPKIGEMKHHFFGERDLLEVGSGKAKTDVFYLGLLLCGSSHFSSIMETLIPIFMAFPTGENL